MARGDPLPVQFWGEQSASTLGRSSKLDPGRNGCVLGVPGILGVLWEDARGEEKPRGDSIPDRGTGTAFGSILGDA